MRQTFTIPGKLPSLNDLIHATNHSRYSGNDLKRKAQITIGWAIRAAHMTPMTGLLDVTIDWYEPNKRRDPDNVFSAVKYILDALQPARRGNPGGLGIIDGDGQKHIRLITNHLHIDRLHPRVEVTLES